MKLATLAVAAAALFTVSNAALAADTPAPATDPTAAATPAVSSKPSAEPAHKSKSASAESAPKSQQARCAAKIGQSTGDNKWEFKGDEAEKAYVACVAKAD
jgi:hypothetical protein